MRYSGAFIKVSISFSVYLAADEARRNQVFLSLWTKKEAIFKTKNLPAFAPSRLSSLDFDGFSESRILAVGEKKYILSIAASSRAEVRIIEAKL